MQRIKRISHRIAAAGLIAGALVAISMIAYVADKQSSEESQAPYPAVSWLSVELMDVRTGQTFTLAQFADKPILLEIFAIWCPTCTSQQRQLVALHEEVGDAVISVSLNIDPNETQDHVIRHLDRHGFHWLYAVSPVELLQALRNEFGVAVLNPPSAPVILICPGQTERILIQKRGVKRPDFLQEQIAACPAVERDGRPPATKV